MFTYDDLLKYLKLSDAEFSALPRWRAMTESFLWVYTCLPDGGFVVSTENRRTTIATFRIVVAGSDQADMLRNARDMSVVEEGAR